MSDYEIEQYFDQLNDNYMYDKNSWMLGFKSRLNKEFFPSDGVKNISSFFKGWEFVNRLESKKLENLSKWVAKVTHDADNCRYDYIEGAEEEHIASVCDEKTANLIIEAVRYYSQHLKDDLLRFDIKK